MIEFRFMSISNGGFDKIGILGVVGVVEMAVIG
jgi:hypothetical protein